MCCRHSGDDVKGPNISPRRFSRDPVDKRQVRPCSLRAAFLRLQGPQAPGLVDHGTLAVAAPGVEGVRAHPDPAGGLSDCATPGYRCIGLSELGDHLLRRASPPGHFSPFLRPDTNISPGPVLGGRSTPALARNVRFHSSIPCYLNGSVRYTSPTFLQRKQPRPDWPARR